MMSSRWRRCLAAGLFFLGGANAAMAQGAPPAPVAVQTADGWTVSFMPYLWVAGLTTTLGTPRVNVTSTVSFTDIIGHLSAPPVMGMAEIANGRFAVATDIIALAERANVATKGVLFNHASLKLFTAIGTAVGTYRLIDTPDQWLALGAGVRAMGVDTNLYLHPGLLPAATVDVGKNVADPLLVVRYHARLSDDFGLSFYGDVGGFGVGTKLTWQVLGTVDYTLSPTAVLSAGYRYMEFDFKGTRGVADLKLAMNGPFIGVKFKF